jgi:hypothetical protein
MMTTLLASGFLADALLLAYMIVAAWRHRVVASN